MKGEFCNVGMMVVIRGDTNLKTTHRLYNSNDRMHRLADGKTPRKITNVRTSNGYGTKGKYVIKIEGHPYNWHPADLAPVNCEKEPNQFHFDAENIFCQTESKP